MKPMQEVLSEFHAVCERLGSLIPLTLLFKGGTGILDVLLSTLAFEE